MKMQLGVAFLVQILLFLFICTCNGAPPGGPKSRYKFSEQEDNFIIEELSNLLDGTIPVYTREVWNKIAEKHNEKRKAKADGFSKGERSSLSLRGRFRNTLLQNHEQTKVKVPEALMRKIMRAHELKLEQGGHDPHRFNKEEDEFIIEELVKLSSVGTRLLGRGTLEAIHRAHDEKRRANIKGFENERTYNSILKRVFRIKQRGDLPEDVVQKFKMNPQDITGAGSSTSAGHSQQSDLQNDDIFGDILDDPLLDLDISDIS